MKRYRVFLKENSGTIPSFSVEGDEIVIPQQKRTGIPVQIGGSPQWAIKKAGEIVALVPQSAAVLVEIID